MSLQNSYPPCVVDIHPAPALAACVLLASILILLAFIIVPVDPALYGVGVLFVAATCRHAMDWCLLRLASQARRLVGHADGRWTLVLNDDSRHEVRWQPGLRAGTAMIAASLRADAGNFSLLLLPANSPAGPRRRLAVRLHWTPADELWSREPE